MPVSVATIELSGSARVARTVGTIRSPHTVEVRSQVSGVLSEVLFSEGQMVRKGDLLARIDDRSLTAKLQELEADRKRIQVSLEAARKDLQRFEALGKENLVATQNVEAQAATVGILEAELLSRDAAIESARIQLSHTRIVAPISGRAGFRRVDPGNLVQGEILVTLTRMSPLEVSFQLPQQYVPGLRAAMEGGRHPTVRVIDPDSGVVLGTGEVELMDNSVTLSTGTIPLRAPIGDASALWPGQYVNVEVDMATTQEGLSLPARGVLRGRDGAYVYRVVDGKAERVPVRVAFEDSGRAEVVEGVSDGDVIVVDGQSRLVPGAPVKVVGTSTASRGG